MVLGGAVGFDFISLPKFYELGQRKLSIRFKMAKSWPKKAKTSLLLLLPDFGTFVERKRKGKGKRKKKKKKKRKRKRKRKKEKKEEK